MSRVRASAAASKKEPERTERKKERHRRKLFGMKNRRGPFDKAAERTAETRCRRCGLWTNTPCQRMLRERWHATSPLFLRAGGREWRRTRDGRRGSNPERPGAPPRWTRHDFLQYWMRPSPRSHLAGGDDFQKCMLGVARDEGENRRFAVLASPAASCQEPSEEFAIPKCLSLLSPVAFSATRSKSPRTVIEKEKNTKQGSLNVILFFFCPL